MTKFVNIEMFLNILSINIQKINQSDDVNEKNKLLYQIKNFGDDITNGYASFIVKSIGIKIYDITSNSNDITIQNYVNDFNILVNELVLYLRENWWQYGGTPLNRNSKDMRTTIATIPIIEELNFINKKETN